MDVDDYAEPFPTGIVEKTFRPSVRFTGIIKQYIYLDFEAGIDFVDNFNHVDGQSENLSFVSFRLTALLYSLFKLPPLGS